MMPEQLAHAPLRPVTFDRHPEFPRRRDPEAGRLALAGEREDQHVTALMLPALVVDRLEVGALPDVLMTAKTAIA
jgi:hypothetical protein